MEINVAIFKKQTKIRLKLAPNKFLTPRVIRMKGGKKKKKEKKKKKKRERTNVIPKHPNYQS